MSDEIVLEGKEYISSKRASGLSGYAQDYIGQLARSGQIEARRVGGLWYISGDSLLAYKEKTEEYTPVLPTDEYKSSNPESLVSFDGKDYISSIRGSKLTGYTQDYIGQLARSGKIPSRQVGNRWYVDRASLLGHKEEKNGLLGAVQAESVGLTRSEITQLPDEPKSGLDEAYFHYLADPAGLLPSLTKDQHAPTSELSDKYVIDLHSAEQKIPIRAIRTMPKHEPLTGVTRPSSQQIVNVSRTRRGASSSVKKHLAIGALSIVVVLSVGFVSFKSRSVYALLPKNSAELSSLSASAVIALNNLGTILEDRFVPQLNYQRQD